MEVETPMLVSNAGGAAARDVYKRQPEKKGQLSVMSISREKET